MAIEGFRLDPGVLATKISHLEQDVLEIKDEIKSLRRAFYTLAVSIAGSAVVFAITIFATFGR